MKYFNGGEYTDIEGVYTINVLSLFKQDILLAKFLSQHLEEYMSNKHGWDKNQWDYYYRVYLSLSN